MYMYNVHYILVLRDIHESFCPYTALYQYHHQSIYNITQSLWVVFPSFDPCCMLSLYLILCVFVNYHIQHLSSITIQSGHHPTKHDTSHTFCLYRLLSVIGVYLSHILLTLKIFVLFTQHKQPKHMIKNHAQMCLST